MFPFVSSLVLLALAQATAPVFKPGETVEKVVCRQDPDKSYALYLPSTYTPEKKWPILFAFDPRRRGKIPLELFREAAEELGFVIVSSNDYFSDGPIEPAWEAARATWADAIQRFPLDPNRLYATGFSGGARIAWLLADYSPVPFAGIIGVGGGFPRPDILDSVDSSRLSFFGVVGTRDFNYYEMHDLDARLDETSIPHRLATFDDSHNWPPQALAAEALEWMQVEAARRLTAGRDPEFLEGYFARRLVAARRLEESGDFLGAFAAASDLVRQQAGFWEREGAVQFLKHLSDSKAFSGQRKRHERARREYDSSITRAELALGPLRDRSLLRPRPFELIRNLGLPDLLRRRKDKNRERALAASRVLESIRVATAFYIARDLRAAQDWKRLQVSLLVAAEIEPEVPAVWFRLAGAYARDGEADKAIETLRKAVEKGFHRPELLRMDEDLASLRADERFQEILATLERQ